MAVTVTTAIITAIAFLLTTFTAVLLVVLAVTSGGWWLILEVPGILSFSLLAIVTWKTLGTPPK